MEPVIAANADLAWMLAAFVFVLFMFPGLALYYGGMVGARNILNMMTMVMSTLGITAIIYVLFGYGLQSGPSVGGWGLIGNPADYLGMTQWMSDDGSGTTQTLYYLAWFILFAAITIAIVASGAAGRMKFSAWMVFAPIWLIVVYLPVAHWVFSADTDDAQGGFLLNDLKIHDYAGGTAVHMNSGVAALALALVLGARRKRMERPNNVPMALLGGGILWFGWFGFNAGSALAANGLAAAIFLNTLVAGCLGMLGWLTVEQIRDGKPTTFGAASGVVAGLVAITPSCGTVNTLGAAVVGLAAGIVCSFAIGLKFRLGYDDSLDVVGVHFVGGVVGVLLIGLLATEVMTSGANGLLYGGGLTQLGKQALAAVAVAAYAFAASYLLAKLIDTVIGFRISAEDESSGVDFSQHAETAYAEGVHGHVAPRRPGSLGGPGTLVQRPDTADERRADPTG